MQSLFGGPRDYSRPGSVSERLPDGEVMLAHATYIVSLVRIEGNQRSVAFFWPDAGVTDEAPMSLWHFEKEFQAW